MIRVQSSESSENSSSWSTDHRPPATDDSFLLHAARLASRGLGRTWPNPSVGCVLVKHGAVIAAARTADMGRPHAETQALEQASAAACGATAYVTLEPCAHHGQTPPCAQALIDAGIVRVVYGCADADPRVSGKGAATLKAAGIDVEQLTTHDSLLTPLYRGFFRRIRHGLPEVSLKIATSLDAQMADSEGKSQWITGPQARKHGHWLRSQHDAVLTGVGTALADDPRYSVRLPGLSHERLVRVVADRQLRLPLESQLVRTADIQPLWLLTTARAVEQQASHATELRERGVSLYVVDDERLQPISVVKLLATQGLTRVLVEAGTSLTTAFLDARAVDMLHWYRAPLLLGNTGQAAIAALDTALHRAAAATLTDSMTLGPDRYERYELPSCLPD